MAHDVFISYASEDKITADAVCAGLERAGIRCWIAPRDILPSDNYDDAIIRAINSAKVMVVIFSSNIFQSQFVKSEVERGFSKGLVIAPFRIENVSPEGGLELYLGRRHWLDAITPPMEAHIQTLAKIVRSMLDLQAAPAGVPAAAPASPAASAPEMAPEIAAPASTAPAVARSNRPAWLAAGAVGIIAVVGGICLLVVAAIFINNLAKGRQAALARTPTAAYGYPTQAAVVPSLPTSLPSANIPLAPTAPVSLPSGGSSPAATSAPASSASGNWLALTDLPRSINAFTVDPDDASVIYAATGNYAGSGGGIYKSGDQGITWTRLETNLPNVSIKGLAIVGSGRDKLLLATTDQATFTSGDGVTWTQVNKPAGSSGFGHYQFAVSQDRKSLYAVVESQGLARTQDGGQSWTPLNDGLPATDQGMPYLGALAIDSTNPLVMYAGMSAFVGAGQGVYKSVDGGETWAASNKGMLDYAISALAVDPANPQVVYAGSSSGDLFKSTDGGGTWTNLKDRLVLRQYGEPRVIHTIQIDPSGGTIYLIGDNSGVLFSTNGGDKWSLLGNPPGLEQPTYVATTVVFGAKPVILVSIDRQDTLGWRYSDVPVVRATAPASTAPEATSIPIKISGTWSSIADLPREVDVFAVNPKDPRQVFAGTPNGLFKSADGGATWQASSSGLQGLAVTGLVFSAGDAPTIYAVASNNYEIFASTDQGQTWTSKGKTGVLGGFGASLVASPSDPQVIYFVSGEGCVRTSDGGQSWQPLGDGLPKDQYSLLVMTIAIDPSDPKVIYAGTGGFVGGGQGVFKSSDSGETWTASNKGMLDYRITALAVDPKNPLVVYAGGDSGDLFKSSDAGQTWTNLKDKLALRQYGEPREIRSILVDPLTGVVYVLGDNSGLLYSLDAGNKFKLIGIPPGTEQPQLPALAVIPGESPAFFISVENQGGAWRYGP